jgi:hypothetical protein
MVYFVGCYEDASLCTISCIFADISTRMGPNGSMGGSNTLYEPSPNSRDLEVFANLSARY